MNAHYVIVDAFPQPDGPHFAEFAGAVIGCWVASSALGSVDEVIRTKLEEEGWLISHEVSREVVSERTYAGEKDGSEEFALAIKHGFWAHFHQIHREEIELCADGREGRVLDRSVLRAFRREAWSFHVPDVQWANGVTENENEFLPLWPTAEEAKRWQEHWPDHELVRIEMEELLDAETGLLQELLTNDMWVGIGHDDCLSLTHPDQLRAELARR